MIALETEAAIYWVCASTDNTGKSIKAECKLCGETIYYNEDPSINSKEHTKLCFQCFNNVNGNG